MKYSAQFFVLLLLILSSCNEFDGEILSRNPCKPFKFACWGCKGSSYLKNTSTDKIITFVVSITTTPMPSKKSSSKTKRIELFPGEESILGSNYEYLKSKKGEKCADEKLREEYYQYQIVGQIISKESK